MEQAQLVCRSQMSRVKSEVLGEHPVVNVMFLDDQFREMERQAMELHLELECEKVLCMQMVWVLFL